MPSSLIPISAPVDWAEGDPMVRRSSLSLFLTGVIAATLLCLSGSTRAEDLNHIRFEYNGGPLIQNVHVVNVFYGNQWNESEYGQYIDSFQEFFQLLFDDGRFMANLAQYSAGKYTIHNGEFWTSWIDPIHLGDTVTDSQIRAELLKQIKAGNLSEIDSDVLYVVYTPKDVVVKDRSDADSLYDFAGYHDYATEGGFAYAVVPFGEGDLDLLTEVCTHELAEAVTDPGPDGDKPSGWYDDENGEIGDIPLSLFEAKMIGEADLHDHLIAPDGTSYVVQKIWSVKDGKSVAFAD
jgi:hypothetical protein